MSSSKDFFSLPKSEKIKIFNATAYQLGIKPNIIEKDLWVCWALEQLFCMQLAVPIVFKGGTSLSKAYNLIRRFSEDIDITLDYRGFKKLDQPLEKYTRSYLKKLSEELKKCVYDCVYQIILPNFKLSASIISDKISFEVGENGEEFRIFYPSVFASSNTYLAENIKLEFGGRNSVEPNSNHTIQPYLTEFVKNLALPIATVVTLSPARTFWEKATLIHVECHKKNIPARSFLNLSDSNNNLLSDNNNNFLAEEQYNRLSRHWYDLAILSESKVGKEALSNIDLLRDVVKIKQAFYYSSYANYEKCLNKQFQLIPNDLELSILEKDFKAMLSAGMFYGEEPLFSEIITKLRNLEQQLNK